LIDATRAIRQAAGRRGLRNFDAGTSGAVAKIADGVVVGSAIVRFDRTKRGRGRFGKIRRSLRAGWIDDTGRSAARAGRHRKTIDAIDIEC